MRASGWAYPDLSVAQDLAAFWRLLDSADAWPPRARASHGCWIKRKTRAAHPTCRAGNSADSTRAWRSCPPAPGLHGRADRRRGRGERAARSYARSISSPTRVQPSSTPALPGGSRAWIRHRDPERGSASSRAALREIIAGHGRAEVTALSSTAAFHDRRVRPTH